MGPLSSERRRELSDSVAANRAEKKVDFQSQRNSLNGPRVSAASATRK